MEKGARSVNKSLEELQIEVAQRIIDSLFDIRPHLSEKTVIRVESVFNQHNTAILHMSDGSKEMMTGLFAKIILSGKVPE